MSLVHRITHGEPPEQVDNPATSIPSPAQGIPPTDDAPLDIVDEASIESFPASDAPSWTFGIERPSGEPS